MALPPHGIPGNLDTDVLNANSLAASRAPAKNKFTPRELVDLCFSGYVTRGTKEAFMMLRREANFRKAVSIKPPYRPRLTTLD